MANPTCVNLTASEVKDAIRNWLTSAEKRDEALNNYVAQMVDGFDASWSIDEKINKLFPYFDALLKSYNKGKDSVTIPDTTTITLLINEDMNASIEENERKKKEGPVYIGGEFSTVDDEITGVLDNIVEVEGRSAESKKISNFVLEKLKKQLSEVGIDMSKSENAKLFNAFVNAFSTN